MPFIIPAMIIGGSVVAIVYSAKLIFNKDDSLDQKAAKLFKSLPEHVQKHVKKIEPTANGGLVYRLKDDAPEGLEDELERNIEIES